jgi:hypothetical protein
MKKIKSAAAFVIAAGLVAALAMPADAASKKKRYYYRPAEQPTRTIYTNESGRRVVIVHPRSYLDAGTEVQRGERHFSDYANPPNYTAYPDRTDWKGSWDRMPFPNCFDLASMCRY